LDIWACQRWTKSSWASEDRARSVPLGPCFFEPSGGTCTEQAKAGGNDEDRR